MIGSPFHGIFGSPDQPNGRRGWFLSGRRRGIVSAEDGMSSETGEGENSESRSCSMSANKAGQTGGKLAVDIFDQDDYTIIRAPIAGVRLSDIDIEVNDNVLTIRGVRRHQDAIQANQYYLQECFWGPFSRTVTLPVIIDSKKVRATFSKDCVLKVLIPKEEKTRIIPINEA